MWLTQSAKFVGAAMASGFRRYAAWLVAISWKRFVLLSILLLIIAGMLGNLPPFSWKIAERPVKASRVHKHPGDVAITLDDKGVQIEKEIVKEPDAELTSSVASVQLTSSKPTFGDETEQTPVSLPMNTWGRTTPASVPLDACKALSSAVEPTVKPLTTTERVITAG